MLLNTTAPGSTTASFAAQKTSPSGRAPKSVAIGDLNGDGKPDLAVANYGSDTVSVLLNTTAPGATAPSFAAQQTFAVGSGPNSVAIGDLNGDGKPDLAVANYDSGTVSVLLNTTAAGSTTASFSTQATFAVGSGPESVAIGDLNGDGKADLAVANAFANTVSVLLNTTAPSATITTATATGTINFDDVPKSITATAGNNQSTEIGTAFATALAATVKDAGGNLIQNVPVDFIASASAPAAPSPAASIPTSPLPTPAAWPPPPPSPPTESRAATWSRPEPRGWDRRPRSP